MQKTNLNIPAAVCVLMMALTGSAAGKTIYVDPNGSADFTSIQTAIDDANDGDQIEVAAGTYNEAINFNGKAIRLYSTAGPNDTIIDGTGNYHVVQCVSVEGPNTILEGFTITGGNANGPDPNDKRGGGMFNENSSPMVTDCNFSGNSAVDGGGMYNLTNSSPTVTSCSFAGNSVVYSGGGMYNNQSSPSVADCTFSQNTANTAGGMVNVDGSNPTVTNCAFSGNTAASNVWGGGGMCNLVNSSPRVINCTFTDNTATYDGGGMSNYENSSPTVTNCIFSGNETIYEDGGGMFNYNSDPNLTNCVFFENTAADVGGAMLMSNSSPTVTNCTFYGNSAVYAGAMRIYQSSPTVTNCILWGNTATISGPEIYAPGETFTVTYSDVEGGTSEIWFGTGCIDTDPLFVNSVSGDMRLGDVSPCVDAGNNNAVPVGVTTDLDGNLRFVDDANVADKGAGTAPIVDMGAYERQMNSVGPIYNVTHGFYYLQIQAAIEDANNGDEIEVSPGMYNEAINFNGKAITLRSSHPNDPYIVATTIIDGTGHYHVVQCVSGEDANTVLDGFTITGGNANGPEPNDLCGGGMYNSNSSPTVSNCTFFNNSAIGSGFPFEGGWGGGMYNYDSSPTVSNCTFINNSATGGGYTFEDGGGGGMYNKYGSPTITNCTFNNNSVTSGDIMSNGGGMCNYESSPTVTNCTFSENTAMEMGGGMYNEGGSPTVTDCNFIGNSAYYGGGGMYNLASSPTVTNCTFSNNMSSPEGGGMCNDSLYGVCKPTVTNCTFSGNDVGMCNFNSSPIVTGCIFSNNAGGMLNYNDSNPTITNCTFSDNTASNGGGMFNQYSDPTLTNCTFSNNTAQYNAGGMWNYSSSPTMTNCTFCGNSASGDGGAIRNYYNSSPTMTNCTFRGNSTSGNGGAMHNSYNSTSTVTNCILWGNTPDEIYGGGATVTYSDVQGGYGGVGNINKYPMFVDAGAGDFRLTWYSPCVDVGDNNAPGLPATDLDGKPRIIDGDGDGNSLVDMGVYELEGGMFKVGIGTLAVTIEPNEAVDAGAKWRVESVEQWFDCGDVVLLPPGYYKVEVNELPDWYEPETLLVGYDTVDSNNVPQQTLWVRVIGDMNSVVTVEYKPLPVFDIGQIPPRDAPHGRRLEFFVDANWLGDDVLYSFTTTFDPNYPEPEGPISFDVNSGLFTYEPNDAYDRTAFTVTFRAESVADVNEQAVKVKPMRDLPLEYEILSAPVQEIPDPCDYIFVNDVNSDSEKELNGELKYVRSVTIAGELIFIEDVAGNPVYVYNNNLDVNDLTICADTLIIRDRLLLPQTDVTIHACSVIFEDRPGSITDINTTPLDLPSDEETDGLPAGNIGLYIESYEADGGLNGRFIMNGTKGYNGGSPGDDGVLTCSLDNPQPFAWLSPYALKMVIARARDTYLYRYTAETHDILSEYAGLLNTYRALPEWNELDELWQYEFEQMHQEIIVLLHRIDNGLDYFGNPPDWVPALSFEVLYTTYKTEIDHAIRVMYLSYWLQNKADDISKKKEALSNCRSQLWDDTKQAKKNYYTCKKLIGPLKAEADSITSRIGTADGECYGLLCDLKTKEQELLERAKRNVHEANKVPWWKSAGRAIAAIGTSMFKGASAGSSKGPKGAAAGALAGGVIGSISVLTDDSIMNPNPWPKASLRTDVVKQFNSIDFDQVTEGWIDDFNDIEEGDIEAQGVEGYLQNLRANAEDMADGLWGVKEALKTTSLDNEEVETELMKIKASTPEFNKLVDDVTELMVDKQIFNRKLAAAMQKVVTLSNSMTNNVLAIDAMNRDSSHLNRIVDPHALMYLKDMERRALARLRKYHYYMAKAYEYRLLEPYPGDLNINVMFTKIKAIAADPCDPETVDGRLGPDDFEALKVVYEDELKQLTEHILTLFLSGRVEKNVPTWIEIYDEDELRQINSGKPLTVNLFEEGLFPSDKENIRIVDMRVEDANMVVTLTGDCNGFGQIVVKMQHPAISKLQYFQQLEPGTENIYQFRHLAEDTKDLLNINWESEYNIVNRQLSHPQLSASHDSLLWTLLGVDNQENVLIYSRPGAWADVTITKRDNLPKKPGCPPCQGNIDYLLLRVEYDYYDKQTSLQTLHVSTWPIIPAGLSEYELLPYFLVDTPDECGRQDGTGNFYRIYNTSLVPEVSITAPETYGNWRFDKWTYLSGGDWVNEYGLTLEFEFSPYPYDNPTVWADYVYEGPILSIADFDEDYDVDFEDYAALSRVWLTQPSDPEWDAIYDVSDPPDDYIDWRDMAVLCGNWLADTGSEL